MKLLKRVLSSLFFCFALFFSSAFALDTATHEQVNEFTAINNLNGYLLDSYLKNQLGLSKGIKEEFKNNETRKVSEWIKIGGKKEDIPYLYMPYLRSVNHFHNPLTEQGFSGIWGTGFLFGQSSVNWSHTSIGNQYPGGHYSWYDVRDYFYKALTETEKITRETNYAETFRGLGQVMHLVEDMSVPEHTRDDGHYIDAYEAWVKGTGDDGERNVKIFSGTGIISIRNSDIQSYTNITPIFYDSSAVGNPNPLAPVPFANLFDTNQYNGINPNITLQSNIGLSEYTNANFLSPDSMFTAEFPYPAWSSVTAYDEVLDINTGKKKTYLKKLGFAEGGNGESINHLAAGRWFYKYLPSNIKNKGLTFDDRVYSDYAQKLIPRAVGYSAGLLNYFFRGDIDMVPDDTLGYGYVIVNNTEEDMDGTFELYYDNADDERLILWSNSLTLGTLSSGNNISSNINLTIPADAIRFVLVFRGRLGNEDDAVVGKDIILLPFLIFLHNGQSTLFMTFDKDLKLTSYQPFALNITNAGLSGIETTPATIQSNETFTVHYYMPSTTQDKTIPPSSFKEYGRLYGNYLFGNRNSFTPTGWDTSSPLQYSTDLSYLSYPSDYLSSGRLNWDYSGNSVLKNLEAWNEPDSKPHIRYTTDVGVVTGGALPYSEIYAVLSPDKVIGVEEPETSSYQHINKGTLTRKNCPSNERLADCSDISQDIWNNPEYAVINVGYNTCLIKWPVQLTSSSGYYETSDHGVSNFYFGDVVLGYTGSHSYSDVSMSVGDNCTCQNDSRFTSDALIAEQTKDSWTSSIYSIKDYDNINDDDTFIVIYTGTGQRYWSTGSGYSTQNYSGGNPYNVEWWQGNTQSYYIAYRLKGGLLQQEEIGWNGYVSQRTQVGTGNICDSSSWSWTDTGWLPAQFQGKAMFNPSTKIFDYDGKTYIVYSYSIYDYVGDPNVTNSDSESLSDWQFNTRIVGLIDADTGQKSETEITDVFLGNMYNFFDETRYGAIGFHNNKR